MSLMLCECLCVFHYRRHDGGAPLLQHLQRLHTLLVVEDQRVLVLLQRVAPRTRARQPSELGQLLVHAAVGLIVLLHAPFDLGLLPTSVCIKRAIIRIQGGVWTTVEAKSQASILN